MKAYGSALQLATAVQSFWNTYFTTPDPFEGMYYTRRSTQKTDTFTRLGAAPLPAAWVGDRNAKPAKEYSFAVTNNNYEATVRVDKDLIRYQQWDEVNNLVGNLGAKARALVPSLSQALLDAGASTVCEDGQNFFDTDHKSPGAFYTTNQDNDLTADWTTDNVPTAAEFLTAIRACFNKTYTYKDDVGDPASGLSTNPADFIVIIPPQYFSVANQVLTADTISSVGDNDCKGRFTLRINPWDNDSTPDQFFFVNMSTRGKPIIVNEAGGIELTNWLDEATGDYLYSATWAGTVAYGEWRTIISYIGT